MTLIKRVLKIVVGIELVYLLLVNGALQLQLTQDLVNKIRPEKFYVSWEPGAGIRFGSTQRASSRMGKRAHNSGKSQPPQPLALFQYYR